MDGMKSILITFTALGLIASPLGAAANTVDYEKAGDQACSILSRYLQVDTTVPPGNEKDGALFLRKVLAEEGIESEVFDTAPNRACLYARLKGNGKKKGIILLNHIDVVPAEPADWKFHPFKGEIHDGEIWGRGALDMKGMGVIELMAMVLLKRSGKELDRDIIFLATPDEEVGGEFGAGWFVKNKPELVKNAEFLLNEGFSIESDESGKQKYWGVDYAEKSALWLELTTRGEAGHASMPLAGASTNRLVRALNKIDGAGPNFKVLPPVKEYFAKIAMTETGDLKELFKNIESSVEDESNEKAILSDVLKSSMLRNTISLTVMKAGYKTNVIPAEASAQLDCRLLPGVEKDDFVAFIKKTINDDGVDIKVLEWNKAFPSSMDTELVECIKAVAAEESSGAPVVPVIVPWFTDSHWFRELGVQAYGFEPVEVDSEHFATMHGKDERIPVDAFKRGVKRMHQILDRLCTAK
ncbi:MAG: M20/M25/M40 family metallo-hydrolase [Cyanobacteria bacterium HKST-UBA02]|nr:M20/M25/M40 family metallo-hydrolase [Cyanobacteria bacterium HKST-UBA02]